MIKHLKVQRSRIFKVLGHAEGISSNRGNGLGTTCPHGGDEVGEAFRGGGVW